MITLHSDRSCADERSLHSQFHRRNVRGLRPRVSVFLIPSSMTHFNDIAKLYALRPSGHGLCALAPSLRGKRDEADPID